MALLVVLVSLLVSMLLALPVWPYSARWTYYPCGTIGAVTVVLTILIVSGYL